MKELMRAIQVVETPHHTNQGERNVLQVTLRRHNDPAGPAGSLNLQITIVDPTDEEHALYRSGRFFELEVKETDPPKQAEEKTPAEAGA